MSAAEWTIVAAQRGDFRVFPCLPRTDFGGARHFAYVLTQTTELCAWPERLRRIQAGESIPRVVKVAVRGTFDEIDRLARKWEGRR